MKLVLANILFLRHLVFEFFKKKQEQPKQELKTISFPNSPDPVPSDEKAEAPFERISDIKELTIEEELIKCFFEYSKYTAERLLPSHVIKEIIERIKLNLLAEDLLIGVNEILEQNEIEIQNPALFKNFILACKVFYNGRKNFFLNTSHESFNQLQSNIRFETTSLAILLSHKLGLDEYPDFMDKEKIHLSEPPRALKSLTLDGLYATSEKSQITYGLTRCSLLSDIAIKEFLKIEGEKHAKFIQTSLEKKGDHGYNVIASDVWQETNNGENKLCFNNGLVDDLWTPAIYPVEQTLDLVRAYKQDPRNRLNYTYPITPEMLPTQIIASTDEIDRMDFSSCVASAIYSYQILQLAAEEIITATKRYRKPEDSQFDFSNFFKSKRNDLMDFIEDIQFSIDELNKEENKEIKSVNITFIDQINKQVENFYTTLFCKILSVQPPKNGALFFDNSEYWQEARAYLNQCIEIAQDYILPDGSSEPRLNNEVNVEESETSIQVLVQ